MDSISSIKCSAKDVSHFQTKAWCWWFCLVFTLCLRVLPCSAVSEASTQSRAKIAYPFFKLFFLCEGTWRPLFCWRRRYCITYLLHSPCLPSCGILLFIKRRIPKKMRRYPHLTDVKYKGIGVQKYASSIQWKNYKNCPSNVNNANKPLSN